MKLFITALLFLFLHTSPSPITTISVKQTGRAVKIIDGDTFDLLTKEKKILRIRLYGIDCPERKQDFYQSAKKALAGYIFNKEVEVSITGRDRNRRMIGMVFCNAQNINLAMIKDGYAWHYKKYSADTAFAKAEKQARAERKGLWSKSNAIAPWEFRKK